MDYLFIGAHPDDCEISCGGTILHFKNSGKSVGILDLTEGELGTYGSLEERREETRKVSDLLGLDYRDSLGLLDGAVTADETSKKKLAGALRVLSPKVVVSFGLPCRHPDHSATANLVREAVFLSGVKNYKGIYSERFLENRVDINFKRPTLIKFVEPMYGVQKPDFVIDITPYFDKKVEAIKCFSSQVKVDENKPDEGVKTLIKSGRFWQILRSTNQHYGAMIDCGYGEGFFSETTLQISDPIKHCK